jgi:hypothetical protein
MSVFDLLNDKSIRIEQRLDIAWRALRDESIHPTSEDRVAAKCWLTYRVLDGAVPVEQWADIKDVEIRYENAAGLEVRWRISQRIAEVYLHGLKLCHDAGWREGAAEAMSQAAYLISLEKNTLQCWPGALLNYLRGMCVLALASPGVRSFIVNDAITTWQRVMGSMDWLKHPMRLVELRDDLSALWQLVAIGKQCGLVEYKAFDWLPTFCGGNDLFAQLMRRLNAPQL